MTSKPQPPRPQRSASRRPSPRLLTCLVLLLAPAAVLLAAVALAAPQDRVQDPEIEDQTPQASDQPVELVLDRPDQRPLMRLAFPETEGLARAGGDFGRAARELDTVLRADLEDTRIFDIQGPWAFTTLTLTGERAHDFEQYRALGNEILLVAEVKAEGDRLVLEGRVYDLASGQAILAKRYRGPLTAGRRIAHTFADEVVRFVAGRRGIAQTRIAFTSTRTGERDKEVYVMDYDGAVQRQVTAHRSTSMSPAWHPDGQILGYTSFVGGAPGLYRAELATGRKRPLVTDGEQNISVSFSPDGRRIAFSRALAGNSEVFVADADGGNLRRLTHSGAIDTSPAWSPTGSEIAFTSSRAGNPHVYVMDAEGTNVRRVSTTGNYNDGAAWGPEGDLLAYATRLRGDFDIAVTDLVSLATRVLTRGPGSHEEPTFSPDGRRIAFTSTRTGGKQVWVMDADGTHWKALTGQGRNESPAWSPYPAGP
ncbi:MAG TPA: Tol-Pal system beta propeller repeat protein TolB [Thermoanaerobaculia bacterium]|nr:Tol-Pal system beta propeller repeat protein TolB [Thermoanaerobaculia bacterium]